MDLANNSANSYDFECVNLIWRIACGLDTVKTQASRAQPIAQALAQSRVQPIVGQI